MRPSVLIISKPVVPPWNDSSKNLVRDIVLGTERVDFSVLTDGSFRFDRPRVTERAIYGGAGRLAPSLRQNARVFGLLLRGDDTGLHHFFFAPNPRTSTVIRTLRRLRRPAAIHTICSIPRHFERLGRALFADVHVALSAHTAGRLEESGVSDVRHIPPCIPPLDPVFDPGARAALRGSFGLPEESPVVLFPGDYEFGRAAVAVAEAARRLRQHHPPVTWVFACRLKTPGARAVEAEIQRDLEALRVTGRALFFNDVPAIHDLLAAADLVVLPAAGTYAKMDLPLVLLEAMALGRPIVVGDRPPLNELPVPEAGFAVEPEDPNQLAQIVEAALSDPADLEVRGRAGSRLAAERFNRERVADQYAELYCSMMQ